MVTATTPTAARLTPTVCSAADTTAALQTVEPLAAGVVAADHDPAASGTSSAVVTTPVTTTAERLIMTATSAALFAAEEAEWPLSAVGMTGVEHTTAALAEKFDPTAADAHAVGSTAARLTNSTATCAAHAAAQAAVGPLAAVEDTACATEHEGTTISTAVVARREADATTKLPTPTTTVPTAVGTTTMVPKSQSQPQPQHQSHPTPQDNPAPQPNTTNIVQHPVAQQQQLHPQHPTEPDPHNTTHVTLPPTLHQTQQSKPMPQPKTGDVGVVVAMSTAAAATTQPGLTQHVSSPEDRPGKKRRGPAAEKWLGIATTTPCRARPLTRTTPLSSGSTVSSTMPSPKSTGTSRTVRPGVKVLKAKSLRQQRSAIRKWVTPAPGVCCWQDREGQGEVSGGEEEGRERKVKV